MEKTVLQSINLLNELGAKKLLSNASDDLKIKCFEIFKEDFELMTIFLNHDIKNAIFMSEKLKCNTNFIYKIFENDRRILQYVSKEIQDEVLKIDIEYYQQKLTTIQGKPVKLMPRLSREITEEISDNRLVVLETIKKNGLLYLHKNNKFKIDKEIFLAAVFHTPWIIQYIPKEFKDDSNLFKDLQNHFVNNRKTLENHKMTIDQILRFASKRIRNGNA